MKKIVINIDAVVSVCEMEYYPVWSNTLSEDLSMDSSICVGRNVQCHKFSTCYRINSAIYMVKNSFLIEDLNIYRKGCYAFIMDRNHSIDIDSCVKSCYNHYNNTLGFRCVYSRYMCTLERRCA